MKNKRLQGMPPFALRIGISYLVITPLYVLACLNSLRRVSFTYVYSTARAQIW